MSDRPDPLAATELPADAFTPLGSESSGDPLAVHLAKARAAAALFGDQSSPQVGRFRILERLGAGGMGVVYSAYDPDLDRAVALKLVRVSASHRDDALGEARALARLAHPNVVPIHDVGVLERHVYLVMELVRGRTLREWTGDEPRTVPEILRAYRQAGAALAAAHQAGLVHRDFKPDNAIVGDDGRVRVVDFGLACEAADASDDHASARIAGTPAYMAPEQKAGRAPTPAADQYSFCASLEQALSTSGDGKKRAVPRWIVPILAKGRAEAPAARYTSMNELVRALEHDPKRAWRQRAAAGAMILGLSAAFAVGARIKDREAHACDGGAAEIAAVWGGDGRAAAIAHVESLGPYGKSAAAALAHRLEDWEGRFVEQQHDACVAHRRGEQSDAMLDRRMACLAREKAAYGAVAETARDVAADKVAGLVTAAGALPSPARCGDLDALVSEPAEPREVGDLRATVARARALTDAGRLDDAERELAGAIAHARQLGDRRALAEALAAEGQRRVANDRASAVPAFDEAIKLATASGADSIAIEAWAQRAYAIATIRSEDNAENGRAIIEAMAERPGVTAEARTLLFNNLGVVSMAAGKRDDARAWWSRAVDESSKLGAESAAIAAYAAANLAIVDPDRAGALLSKAIAADTSALGADHPVTLGLIGQRGALSFDLARAFDDLSLVCDRLATLHPSLRENMFGACRELASVTSLYGEEARGLQALERAAPLFDRTHEETPCALAELLLRRGDVKQAAESFRAAMTEEKSTDAWWVRANRSDVETGLGASLRASGAAKEAVAPLEHAVATLEAIEKVQPGAPIARHLARARVELALALGVADSSSARSKIVAKDAADFIHRSGGHPSVLPEIERLAGAR